MLKQDSRHPKRDRKLIKYKTHTPLQENNRYLFGIWYKLNHAKTLYPVLSDYKIKVRKLVL